MVLTLLLTPKFERCILFGEAMGRIVVGVDLKKVDEFVDLMSSLKVLFLALGHVTKVRYGLMMNRLVYRQNDFSKLNEAGN